jgi:hypothetical protein
VVTSPPLANRAVLAANIKGVMDQFAFPYEIDWREDAL